MKKFIPRSNEKKNIGQKSAPDLHSWAQFQPRFALYSSDKKVSRVHVHLCLKPRGAPYDPYCAPGDPQISTYAPHNTCTFSPHKTILSCCNSLLCPACWLVGLIVTYGLCSVTANLRALALGFPTPRAKPGKIIGDLSFTFKETGIQCTFISGSYFLPGSLAFWL